MHLLEYLLAASLLAYNAYCVNMLSFDMLVLSLSCGFDVCCHQALFQQFKDNEVPIFEMSTLTGEGVMEARTEVYPSFICRH